MAAACVAGIQDADLRSRVEAELDSIDENNAKYIELGKVGKLWSAKPDDFEFDSVTGKEIVWLYNNVLIRKTSAARDIYDMLIALAKLERCPYCNVTVPRSLDHFLPKSEYSFLAIEPWNLVPSCSDCNRTLGAGTSSDESEAMFHPYFESVDGDWLTAEIEVTESGPAFHFSISPPVAWSDVTARRVANIWEKLRLDRTYASLCGGAYAEANMHAQLIHQVGGANAVRAHFRDAAASVFAVSPNSWRGALYRAMADSDWYCSAGFAA